MNLLKTALTYAALFGLGAVTSVACFEPELGNPSFRCSPAAGGGCPEGEQCCSDDPAALGGKLPKFGNAAGEAYGTPIFSNNNNQLSTQGMCVNTEGIPSTLVNGCPLPCNPTWSSDEIVAVCGSPVCCQTQELDPNKDCVVDPMTMRWRAVTGADIFLIDPSTKKPLTSWGGLHSTNQDPQGSNCDIFARGGGTTADEDTKNDCIRQLSVANQRGFCYSECPCIEDVCEMKNADYKPRCTGAPAGV